MPPQGNVPDPSHGGLDRDAECAVCIPSRSLIVNVPRGTPRRTSGGLNAPSNPAPDDADRNDFIELEADVPPVRGGVQEILTRRKFALDNVRTSASVTVILVRALPAAEFAEGTMLVRLHDLTIPTGATLTLRVYAHAPSADFPAIEHEHPEPVGYLQFDDSSLSGRLYIAPVVTTIGTHLRFEVEAARGPAGGTFDAEMSISMLLKERASDPTLMRVFTRHTYSLPGDALIRYVPFNGNVETTTLDDTTPRQRMVAPHDGWLDSVELIATADPGSTIVGLHLNNNTTATATATATPGGANVSGTFRFGAHAKFSRGDRLSLSVKPTNDPSRVNVTCHWVYRRGS